MTKTKAKSKRRPAKDKRVQIVEHVIERDVQNIYEVATVPWLSRSWIYEGINDAQGDITPQVRSELLRQARNWEKNDPIVKRLVSIFGQYTFGPNGLALIPSSAEEGFNESASHWWKGWAKFPCLTSQHPLSVIQGVLSRRWFIDGEIFVYKTQSPETHRPRLQLVEAQRVGNPGTDYNPETGNRIVDGVELTDYGRPVAYHVASSARPSVGSLMGGPWPDSYSNSGLLAGSYPTTSYGGSGTVNYSRVPAERMIHLFEPERADQYRGISHLYPVMRTIHDLYDLKKLEMLAAKDAAKTSTFVTNPGGQANTKGLRAQSLAINSQNAAGQAVTKQTQIVTRQTLGGEREYLPTGTDVKQFTSQRPSVTVQWYWDFLIRTICAGVGISALLVYPWSLQGTVTRADLDIMATFFRTKSAVAAAVMREIYVWAMGWAIRYDRALDGYPADWAEVTVRPPRSVNVDVGRNSQALIAEWEAGFRTLQSICAELGDDWRHVVVQNGIEARFIDQTAKEMGVTPERISQKIKQALTAPPPQTAKNQAAPDDELLQAASAEIAGVL